MYRHRSGEGTVCLDDHRDQERVCKALNLLIRQDVLTDWHTIGRRVRGVERRDHWPSWWTFYTSHITDIDNLLASSMHAVIFVHVYTRVSIYIYIYFLMLQLQWIWYRIEKWLIWWIVYRIFSFRIYVLQ